MNRLLARIALGALLVVVVLPGWSQDSPGIYVEFDPRIIGANLRVGYRLPLLEDRLTSISALGGGAWGGEAYYRFKDDTLYPPGEPADAATHNRWTFIWDAGIEQDLSRSPDLLVAPFIFYRGMRNTNLADPGEKPLILKSQRPDATAILMNVLLFGGYVDGVTENEEYATKSGIYGEASAAYAPPWLANDIVGTSDFTRWNLTLNGFLPMATFESPKAGAYLAGFLAADWVTGEAIPHIVRSSIGGLDPRDALGGAVRGVDAQRFDATVKVAANLEGRIAFTDLFDPWIVPGFVVYVDGGYYFDSEELSSIPAENQGFAFTTGAGLSTNLLELATLVFYTQYYLGGSTVKRDSPWTPFALGFGLHF